MAKSKDKKTKAKASQNDTRGKVGEKGNTYWRYIANWKNGAKRKYTPNTIWNKAIEYFQHINDNPVYDYQNTRYGIEAIPRMRAMTIVDFCLFAEISKATFEQYCNQSAYIDITSRIKDIIYTQKFQGAAAGVLSANIIARDLGLAEHSVSENKNSICIDDERFIELMEKVITR